MLEEGIEESWVYFEPHCNQNSLVLIPASISNVPYFPPSGNTPCYDQPNSRFKTRSSQVLVSEELMATLCGIEQSSWHRFVLNPLCDCSGSKLKYVVLFVVFFFHYCVQSK